MKKMEISLYKFSELSSKIQEKVISSQSDINVDYDWWESTYDDAANIGIKITEFDIDRGNCKGDFNLSAPEVAEKIKSEHGKNFS